MLVRVWGNRFYELEMGRFTGAVMSCALRSQAEGLVVPVSPLTPPCLQVIYPPLPWPDDWEKGSRGGLGRVGVSLIINALGREETQNCVSARLKIDLWHRSKIPMVGNRKVLEMAGFAYHRCIITRYPESETPKGNDCHKWMSSWAQLHTLWSLPEPPQHSPCWHTLPSVKIMGVSPTTERGNPWGQGVYLVASLPSFLCIPRAQHRAWL